MNDHKRRTAEIFARAARQKKKRRMRLGIAAASLGMCFVLTFGLVLFLPYPGYGLPDVSRYADSQYYDLIKTLNPLTQSRPTYKNNFEKWFGSSDSVNWPSADGSEPQYEETTNNQVEGVIEGDLFKRSDSYIYYLTPAQTEGSAAGYGYDRALKIYSIDGAASEEISSFTITADAGISLFYVSDQAEIYLSEDCRTVSVVAPAYDNREKRAYTAIVPLDVSDVTEIRQKDIVYVSGIYASSRSSDNGLILMTNFTVFQNPDFGDEKQYVPQSGTVGNRTAFSALEIVAPENASIARYTIVSIFDGERFASHLAFLSYTAEVYVDRQDIYLTQNFARDLDRAQKENMTRIARVSYAAGSLKYRGAVEIEGSVGNQYAMDVRDGVLRAVTTTSVYSSEYISVGRRNTSASLFCINIDTLEIIASVEKFAPQGEIVRSVRFDGDKAYVCTSVGMSDPVFIIDLGDLSNITIKDSGVIGGYSTSLIKFADDTLLGIGVDEAGSLKVELYVETLTAVESLTAYVQNCQFSNDFKSYMIDSENRVIGLCVETETTFSYLLLFFDGERFLANTYTIDASSCSQVRATVIGGQLYILAQGGLKVVTL